MKKTKIDLKELPPLEPPPKRKGRFGRRVLMISFAAITLYTIWAMWEQHRTGIEPAPTLTQWVYTFWGVEVTLLCLKRIFAKTDAREERKQGERNGHNNEQL